MIKLAASERTFPRRRNTLGIVLQFLVVLAQEGVAVGDRHVWRLTVPLQSDRCHSTDRNQAGRYKWNANDCMLLATSASARKLKIFLIGRHIATGSTLGKHNVARPSDVQGKTVSTS